MSLNANAVHVLDDFLETLEGVPTEIRSRLEELTAKDIHYEEARKALFKKRNLYLRAEEKGLDTTVQAALLRKTEREHAKLLQAIDEKIEVEVRLQQLIEQHLHRLEGELKNKCDISYESPYLGVFAGVPDVQQFQERPLGKPRPSPKKRQTLTDEPIDPNEPVYCHCKQVSYGDMIGCDNPTCPIEWFHYSCVGLTAPPKGKWFCPDCSPK